MSQAGLNKITLYENRNLIINFGIFTVTNSGNIIELTDRPKIIIEPKFTNVLLTLSAQLNDLNQPVIDMINNSVYGWVAKFDYLDLTTKIIETPFFNADFTDLKSNVSNSRSINLKAWNKRGLITFN